MSHPAAAVQEGTAFTPRFECRPLQKETRRNWTRFLLSNLISIFERNMYFTGSIQREYIHEKVKGGIGYCTENDWSK